MGSVGCKAYDLISKDWNTYPVDYLREVSSYILFGLCVAFIFCGTCCFFVKPLFLKGYFDNKFKISDKDTITIIDCSMDNSKQMIKMKLSFVFYYIYILLRQKVSILRNKPFISCIIQGNQDTNLVLWRHRCHDQSLFCGCKGCRPLTVYNALA